MFLVFLLYALFASVFTVLKVAVVYTSPFFLVGSRMFLAGVLMLGYTFFRSPELLRLSKSSIIRVVLLGLCNIYFTNVLEVWGIQYLTSSKTCFLYSLSPFLSVLFSYFLLKEVLTVRKWVGLLVGFCGFIPILVQKTYSEQMTGLFWGFSWAELAVIGAVISSVIGWILLKQLVHGDKCLPLVANGYSMLLGGSLAIVHSVCTEQWNPFPISDYLIWFESLLFLIIVSNIVCYNLYGILLKKFSPTFMAFAGLSTPLFTAAFGWLFYRESVTIWFFVSLSIVFLGLFLFYLEEIRLLERKKDKVSGLLQGTPEILVPRVPNKEEAYVVD